MWTTDPDCGTLSLMRDPGVRYVIIDDSLGYLTRCMDNELSARSRRIADDGRLSVYAFT